MKQRELPKKKNAGEAKKMVMIPLYRMRVCDDKTKFKRTEKHRKKDFFNDSSSDGLKHSFKNRKMFQTIFS